jgi:hypothetical protein
MSTEDQFGPSPVTPEDSPEPTDESLPDSPESFAATMPLPELVLGQAPDGTLVPAPGDPKTTSAVWVPAE